MDRSVTIFQQRQLLVSALAFTSLGAELTTIMALASNSLKASWNDEETSGLVDFLWEHKAEAGEGGNFKDATFNTAAQHIAPFWRSGSVKTAKHCKTKWQSVSFTIYLFIIISTNNF